MPKFKLGPIQKMWVSRLKKFPELQTTDSLGNKGGEDIDEGYCCLGMASLCISEYKGKTPRYDIYGNLISRDKNTESLYALRNYNEIGLRDAAGTIDTKIALKYNYPSSTKGSLAGLNDNGWSWPQIAELIENNPEAVFTKSV